MTDLNWHYPGARCVQTGGSQRHGTILTELYSGYVSVEWDSGRQESMVHIRDIDRERMFDHAQNRLSGTTT